MEKAKVFKKQDVITIAILTVTGIVAAYFATNLILGDPADAKVTFKTIGDIPATVAMPDPEVFNPDAINPTVEVYVGSCEDVDQNGILSPAELSACGEAQVEEEDNGDEEEGGDENGGGNENTPTTLRCADGEIVESLDQCPAPSEENDEGEEEE